ncbi:FAA hydrolase family protein [Amycolatopsis lurida]|uniref:hypothetical protein n=1 Tax=Amycolatopsis lurida TaxID=31959 RepID=UPI00364AC3EE
MVGRKIGLTSPAVQRQLGVDQPDFGVFFGVFFADMDVSGHAALPARRLLQPKIEAEIRVRARDRPAKGHAVAALEIVDSVITGWDISITDTITDNASSGLVSESTGAASLGDPIDALAWLARAARELGDSLRRSRSSSPVRAAPCSPRPRAAASAPTSARAPGNAVG